MTENEEKKEYLKEYQNLCYKVSSLEEQLQSLRETNESAKIQNITDMPKGNIKTDLSDYICKIEKLQEKIQAKQLECDTRKIDIEEKIMDIRDGIESSLLHKRYIEFKTWEEICIDIGYCWKQTHRIHSKALNSIRTEVV
jgi:hypothetical protein